MIPVNDRIATSVDKVASHVVSTARLDGFYECMPRLPSVSNPSLASEGERGVYENRLYELLLLYCLCIGIVYYIVKRVPLGIHLC